MRARIVIDMGEGEPALGSLDLDISHLSVREAMAGLAQASAVFVQSSRVPPRQGMDLSEFRMSDAPNDPSHDVTQDEDAPEFLVYMTDAGPNRIAIIREVRRCADMGLLPAKNLVEAASPSQPMVVKENITRSEAGTVLAALRKEGATAGLQWKAGRRVRQIASGRMIEL